ncbi:MAG: hypothetical protein JST30_03655 [Armatimonadetes bacterium]|nr:hypothetical protein [Armatimonadota bacterium]
MHYILYVALEGFYVADQDDGSGRATVVHQDSTVLDACRLARERGVVPGTALSEAKSILREEGRFLAFSPDVYARAREEWLDTCLRFSDRIEPGRPHEAYVDLTGHARPARAADELLAALAPRQPVAGLAPAKWIARVEARSVDVGAAAFGLPVMEALTDVASFLGRIPTTLLLPIAAPYRERLCFLGYRWTRDVARAGLHELRSQFGSDAIAIQEAAQGRVLDQVAPSYPERSLTVSLEFGAALDDRVVLDLGLRHLAQRCAARLCETDQTAQGVVARFESEDGASALGKREFAKPAQTATVLAAALHALWDTSRCPFPPVSATVHLTRLRPAPRSQRSFTGTESYAERSQTCDRVVRTLTAAYGDGTLVKARDLRVPRRELVLRAWRHATGWH